MKTALTKPKSWLKKGRKFGGQRCNRVIIKKPGSDFEKIINYI